MPFIEDDKQGYSQEPLLPTTKKGTHLYEPGSLKKFVGTPNGLREISDAIEDRRVHKSGDFHSIPDVFAQLDLFDAACRNRDHPLRKSLIEQWRGVLSIIFLHKELSMVVDYADIILKDLPPEASIFFHTAGFYLPPSYNGKIRVYLCRTADGDNMTPIALQMPKTFICPANGIKKTLYNAPGFVCNASEGAAAVNGVIAFKDVAGFLKKNPDYGARMIQMLETAKDAVIDPATGLLQDFIEDIDIRDLDVHARRESGNMLIPELQDYFQAKQSQMLGDFALSSDSIFTEKICVFSNSAMNEGCYTKQEIAGLQFEGSPCFAMLPFSRDFITALVRLGFDGENFDMDDYLAKLADSVRLTWRDNGQIEAELSFMGVIYPKTYEKSNYASGEAFLRASPMTIWPNKVDPAKKWKSYYLFQSASIEYTTEDRLKISVFDGETGSFHKRNPYTLAPDKFYITKTADFPHILYGEFDEHDVGVFLVKPAGSLDKNRDKTAYVGIDFGTTNTIAYFSIDTDSGLTEPSPVKFEDGQTVLSIIKNSNDLHERLITKHFVPFSVMSTNDGVFGSVWHVLNRDKGDGIKPLLDGNIFFHNPDRTVLDIKGCESNLKWGITQSSRRNTNNFIAEITMLCAWKCVEEQADKIHWRAAYPTAYKDFDGYYLAFLTSVKAVADSNEIEFKWDNDDNKKYDEAANSFIMTTENHAAGIGLAHNNCVNREHGFISIDIGGGSTDISVWQKPRLEGNIIGAAQRAVIETSFKYAGNRILSDSIFYLISKNPAENSKIFFDHFLQLNADAKKLFDTVWNSNNPEAFRDAFNQILPMFANDSLKAKFQNHCGEGIVLELAKIVEFNIAAIVSYASDLFRLAINRGNYSMDNDPTTDIVFGGNGSKLLNWTRMGFRSADGLLTKIFNKAGSTEVGNKIIIKQSVIPKREVAYGLVAEEQLFTAISQDVNSQKPKDYVEENNLLLIGENGIVDGQMKQNRALLISYMCRFVDTMLTDRNYGIQTFPGWKCSLDEIKRELERLLGDQAKPYFSYNDGFVLALEKLNQRFFIKR